MRKSFTLILISLLLAAAPKVFAQSAVDIRINEVQPLNETGLTDEGGERCGWIELFNSAYGEVDVTGFFLSDDINAPTKYMIPKGTVRTKMPLRRYLLLYADGQPHKGLFHTNFTLDGVKNLYLFAPDSSLVDQIAIPELQPDESYGRVEDGAGEHLPYHLIQRSLRKHSVDKKVENGGMAVLDHPTPGYSNTTKKVETKSQKMARIDPYGLILAVTAMSVVFLGLALLYVAFKKVGQKEERKYNEAMDRKNGKRREAPEKKGAHKAKTSVDEEIAVAIAVACHAYNSGQDSGIHDVESDIITINKEIIEQSPWGSKYLTLKQDPEIKL